MSPAGRATRRGQPIAALALLLGGWVAARVLIMAMVPEHGSSVWQLAGPGGVPRSPALLGGDRPHRSAALASAPDGAAPAAGVGQGFMQGLPAPARAPLPGPQMAAPPAPVLALPPAVPRPVETFQPVPIPAASGHLMLWMAGIARLGGSGIVVPAPQAAIPVAGAVALSSLSSSSSSSSSLPSSSSPPRWSGDSWLLLRRGGSAALAAGPGAATYGASPVGAVIRYRLAPSSANQPSAYLRATAALNGSREREVAAGLSVRPLARVPIAAAIEARAADRPGDTRLRPAALAWTELPPFEIGAGFRGEAYGQAGYVGGRNKTAFADGQIRVDRQVARIGGAELRAGVGAWAGAQKGASRLDVGPGATLGLPMSERASARVAFDWRLRVAGDARPASGPALTLSAGF